MDKEIVYVCIPTTKERRPRLEKTIASIRANDFPHAILFYENSDGGWVQASHNMLQGIDGIIFMLNDDMVIKPDCISILYKIFKEKFPNNDGLLQPYDNFNKGKIAVSAFCHSSIFKKYLYKGYRHKYSDNELTEIMRNQGKYLYVPEAGLYHDHETDKSKYDETYKLMDSNGAKDKALYEERKRHNFYL